MTAVLNKIPGWGWAIITIILAALLAIHAIVNPIVSGRMICPERELDYCGKIKVVTNEGGHEFYSESIAVRGFFVVPIINRLKKNHPVHFFLIERIGDKEAEVPLGGPILISFANVLSQTEVELTITGYDISKVEYAGGNVFTLVISIFESAKDTAMSVMETALANLSNAAFVSKAYAGDITDLPGFLEVQKSIKSPGVAAASPHGDIFIGQSAPPIADPATEGRILEAKQGAEAAQAAGNAPLSENIALRAEVEKLTGFSIPDSHWQDVGSPEGLSVYLRARAALAEKHPDLFAPRSGISWGEAASKADGLYKEKYIFVPESTIKSLNVQ